jgi:hypothetical protein
VFAWHGTPAQYVEAVCRDGPRAFRTTDGGFFGAGSYFAAELEYATRYALMQVRARVMLAMVSCAYILRQAPSASGEYPVILFAVSVACAYVVSPGRDYPADDPSHPELWGFSKFYSADPSRSVALMARYNAHFVPVKFFGRVHCVKGTPLPLDTDYQAAVEGAGASELRCECGDDGVGGREKGEGGGRGGGARGRRWGACDAVPFFFSFCLQLRTN